MQKPKKMPQSKKLFGRYELPEKKMPQIRSSSQFSLKWKPLQLLTQEGYHAPAPAQSRHTHYTFKSSELVLGGFPHKVIFSAINFKREVSLWWRYPTKITTPRPLWLGVGVGGVCLNAR